MIFISCNQSYSDELKISRPGEGEPIGKCQEEIPKYCIDCNTYFFGKHWCMDRNCPNCYPHWAQREGRKSARKVLFNRKGHVIIHAVVSILGEPRDIFKNLGKVYKIFSSHNVIGGVCVPHFERHGEVTGYNHYHVVGYLKGDYIPGDEEREYVFKVIRYLNDSKLIGGCISYLLTHCAIAKGKHALFYFGKKFKKPVNQELELNFHHCPNCYSQNTVVVPLIDYTGGSNWATGVEIRVGVG